MRVPLVLVGLAVLVGVVGADYKVYVSGARGMSAAPQVVAGSGGEPGATQCSKRSLVLSKQALAHQLETLNSYLSIWFNDLDKDELLEEQKESLANMFLEFSTSTKSRPNNNNYSPLNSEGKPLFEIEASYFRSPGHHQQVVVSTGRSFGGNNHTFSNSIPTSTINNQPISLRLMRQHETQCYLTGEGSFELIVGVSLGPIEHYLDIVYNLPRILRLTQPMEWKYAQVRIQVPRMNYQLTFRQQPLSSQRIEPRRSTCPLELVGVVYLDPARESGEVTASSSAISLVASGLPSTGNQTLAQLERLFADYTLPTVSDRLRQALRFYLSDKTLPLSVS